VESVYSHTNYIELIKSLMDAHREQFGRAYSFARLAEKIKVQRTHLSAVINGKGNLNADQLFLASNYFNLKGEEEQFLELLYQHNTSSCKERIARLALQLKKIRSEKLSAENFVDAKQSLNVVTPEMQNFFLNIDCQLVHMFLNIDRYRKNVGEIRRTLGMSESAFNKAIGDLKSAGLIKIESDKVAILQEDFHLNQESPILPYFKILMRQKAIGLIQREPTEKQFGFSVLFASDKESRDEIHRGMLNLIKSCRKVTDKSIPTEVFQINMDLLQWS
jgi:hypothetical protein